MKAFEEWDKKWCPKTECELKDVRCDHCPDLRKAGWRGALEWYRKTMEEIEQHDLSIHGREVIEQELEGI